MALGLQQYFLFPYVQLVVMHRWNLLNLSTSQLTDSLLPNSHTLIAHYKRT